MYTDTGNRFPIIFETKYGVKFGFLTNIYISNFHTTAWYSKKNLRIFTVLYLADEINGTEAAAATSSGNYAGIIEAFQT